MRVAVLGAGSVNHGIAQVSAMAGHEVAHRDVDERYVDAGLGGIRETLTRGVERDKVTDAKMQAALDLGGERLGQSEE